MTKTNPEEMYIFLPRGEEAYLTTRVLDQIDWFEKKSASNKKWFNNLKMAEIVFSLCIPFSVAYISDGTTSLKIIVGVLGIVVAAIASIMTLLKYHENWVEYRTVAESLKMEKFLYLSEAGPYKRAKEPFKLFVERFESLISTSTKKWMDYTSKKETEKAVEAQA